MRVVAVEEGLANVKDALKEAGFTVVDMGPDELKRAQAVVISGGDIDILQRQDIKTDVPVINAGARSADEIVDDVREKFNLM